MKKITVFTAFLAIFCLNSCSLFPDRVLPENETIEIPIVFHILHSGETIGKGLNIPNSRIRTAFEVLNKHFSDNNTKIRFRLATKNQEDRNLTEPGINRINLGRGQFSISEAVNNPLWKNEILWDPNQYLNVVIADIVTPYLNSGFTRKPLTSSNNNIEGIKAGTFKKYTDSPYNIGVYLISVLFDGNNDKYYRTLTHEIGHYFGLDHVFEGGCTGKGDYCSDTYQYNSLNAVYSQSNGSSSVITCDGKLQIQNNFMDYSLNQINYFSPQQVTRMRTCLSKCLFIKNLSKSTK